jgi:hypothetical protein
MENTTNLYTKLFKIQGLGVKKDAQNPFFKSSYMTLDKIVETLTPLLQENKLLITHRTESKEIVTSVVDTESGEKEESRFPLIETNDPQKYGSCITYAKRYNLGQLFNIITDEDDDGNHASTEDVPKGYKPVADKKSFDGEPVREEEDDKPWYNDFDKHEDALYDKIADGVNPKDIIANLRKKYKVSKKVSEKIMNLK